jgi:hypothetical protein
MTNRFYSSLSSSHAAAREADRSSAADAFAAVVAQVSFEEVINSSDVQLQVAFLNRIR